MEKQRNTHIDAQGVTLMELVIEQVQAHPNSLTNLYGQDYSLTPQPLPADVIETLRFPNGKALSPSLKRWLAFDASWLASLGWFASFSASLTPRRLDEIARSVFGDPWGKLYTPLGARFETCFLLPCGGDSRRVYTVTTADPLGEYPVLVIDVDDLPYTAIMYPGFDVYMAALAGLIEQPRMRYTDFFDDPRYAERLQWHARMLFQGKRGIEYPHAEWGAASPG